MKKKRAELAAAEAANNAEEAVAFLEHMRSVYQYAGVSEADTKKGQIRCDVNVSLMPEGATELGTKVEMKNINSFSSVREAIICEVERQTKILDKINLFEQRNILSAFYSLPEK